VNCREILIKNQYHKKIGADNGSHDYRLLIHKLEDNSLLKPSQKTVYQLLVENIFRGSSLVNSYKIFQKMFYKSSDLLIKDLNKVKTSVTLFVPCDSAFRHLRASQLEALWSDKTCAHKFIAHNLLNEEVCPGQIIKYAADYSSRFQKADFLAVSENLTNTLYFNGQKLNLSKSYTASNGFIYRLATVKLSGVVDFLHDLVSAFRKKFSPLFIQSLETPWLDIVRNESNNVTLFMPFDNLNRSAHLSFNVSAQNSIKDYLIRPKVTIYQLNNGDLLTSLSKRKYLISVYPFESILPDYMRFIPKRNIERKAINCIPLEMPDLSACSAQLITYRIEEKMSHEYDAIPRLNSNVSLLDFIDNDQELSVFNRLLNHCGWACTSVLANLSNKRVNGGGYTILLPVNDFFNRVLSNFNKYSRNVTLLVRTINLNIFKGTYCGFYLNNDILLENLLNRTARARNVFKRIVQTNVYLNEFGILAHKTNSF
jgi:uncharacterized surface protein with fasciclin (FAS1) repeats